MMQKIIPNLWFDRNAEEVVNFYVSLFPDSIIGNISHFEKEGFEQNGMPEGTVMTMEFEIHGQKFVALNGGPHFTFNESVSFYVYCQSDEEIEFLYKKIAEKGSINMPLDKYDWSKKYAWVKDRFGVSWQLDLSDLNSTQKIVPSLLFVNDKFTRVKEAVEHYKAIFADSKIIFESPFPNNEDIPDDTILFAQFSLNGHVFNAMSGAGEHHFDFNEAISFIISCDSQKEVDYFWEKLTQGGQESICGWLKDKFGVSWQVIPTEMFKYLGSSDKEKSSRVMNAMLQMKKLDLNELRQVFDRQ